MIRDHTRRAPRRNPARFNKKVLATIEVILSEITEYDADGVRTILDPFAGEGGIHVLRPGYETWGLELEAEWAHATSLGEKYTKVGDVKNLRRYYRRQWDAIVTSPTYGNRMADHHEAKDGSRRHTYRHTLGRALTDGNSGAMQWGKRYREFHRDAWAIVVKELRPGGWFLLNCKDHIRGGVREKVTDFHVGVLEDLGLVVWERVIVELPGLQHGENWQVRVPGEEVAVLRKGGGRGGVRRSLVEVDSICTDLL